MIDIDGLNKKTILHEDIFFRIMEIDDEITRAHLIVKLTEAAGELGVKTSFEKLLAAYKKEKRRYDKEAEVSVRAPESMERVTEFGGDKYNEMRCGNWIANNNGVRTFTPFGELLACYHPILPVQRLINAETKKEKMKLAYKKGNKWKEIVVDKDVVASSNKIVGLSNFGISVNSENSRNLVRYLSDVENFNVNEIDVLISTSKLGWIENEFMPYGASIVFDSEMKFKDTYESIKENGSETEWLDLVRNIRKSHRLEPKIYLAGSLASVLIEPLNALPFIVNLWGDTGKGKTVAMMLATSVWANPGENVYITDPKSTATALELRLDFLNHLPMMVDDMAQLKDKYGGDFSELVYMLCSGKGKDRANASLGLNKSTSWRNVILTNGEHSLITSTMQGGAINRIIDVEMADGYIFPNGNEVVENIRQNYGHCGRAFIDLIGQIGIEQAREIQKDFLRKINERAKLQGVEKEEKQSLPMSILLTADKIATDYIFCDGEYLDFDVCVDLLKNIGEVSENERAYEFILSEVAINISKFKPNRNNEYIGEVWGAMEKGYVVILSNAFNRIAERGNFSSKSFLSWAGKKGLIQLDAQGKSTRNKRINGEQGRCICVKTPEEEAEFVTLPAEEQSELPFLKS